MSNNKQRAPRNRTITLTDEEMAEYSKLLIALDVSASVEQIIDRIICQDVLETLPLLPEQFVDLLIVDPPYNLDKDFQGEIFRQVPIEQYIEWMERWLVALLATLKPDASIYVCGDWRSSPALYFVLHKYLVVRNRITWEREKGRGAARNWKNNSEDIWF